MRYMLFVFLVFVSTSVFAQSGSAKQVAWTTSAKKISEGVYEIRLSADIKGDYHLYALAAGASPVPTTVKFLPNPLVALEGKLREVGKMIKKYESAWEGDVNYFEKKVEFVQQVKVKGKAKTSLSGKVEFMVCNESQCLPPAEVDFKVAIGG